MSTTVRAKFKCATATKFEGGAMKYEFWPAYGEENKAWAKATPSGRLEIQIDNPPAQVFEPGKHYFLDFTPAD